MTDLDDEEIEIMISDFPDEDYISLSPLSKKCDLDLQRVLQTAREKTRDHPPLYRADLFSRFLKSYDDKHGYFIFKNDFSLCGEGVSFTADPSIAEGFMKTKEGHIKKKEDFPIIMKVRENALQEDSPIEVNKLNGVDLVLFPEIVYHIYDINEKSSKEGIAHVINAYAKERSDLVHSGIYDNMDLARHILEDFYGRNLPLEVEERFRRYVEQAEEWGKGIKQEKEEFMEKCKKERSGKSKEFDIVTRLNCSRKFSREKAPEMLKKRIKEKGRVPHLVLLEDAIEIMEAEFEFITLNPTKIGFDDIDAVYVKVPDDELQEIANELSRKKKRNVHEEVMRRKKEREKELIKKVKEKIPFLTGKVHGMDEFSEKEIQGFAE